MMNETQSITETKTPTQTQASFSLSAAWDQKIGKLHELFAHVAKFVDIGTLSITPKVIQLKAMDASHVGMIDLLLHWHDFKTYDYETSDEIPNPRGFEVRINFKDFVKLLKNFNKPTDRVELEIASFGSIQKKGITVKCNGTELSLATLEIDPEELPIPKITFNCCMELSTKELRETINIPYNLKADYVEFSDGPVKSFRISASSSDGIEFNRTLDNTIYTATPPKQIKSIYSLEYLNDIIPKTPYLVKLLGKCELQFMGEMPAQITFPITDDSRLLYFLAPRVEEEDEDEEEEAVEQRNAETKEEVKEAETECKALENEDNTKLSEKAEAEVQAICKLGGEIITEENYIPASEIQNPEFEDDEDPEEDGPILPKVNCVRCGAALDGEEVEQDMKICGGCIELTIKEHREKDEPYCHYCGAAMTKKEVANRGHNACQQCHDSDCDEPIFKPTPAEPKKVVVYSYSSYDAQKKLEENKKVLPATKAEDPIPFTSASKAEAKAVKPSYGQFAGKYLTAHPGTPLSEVATLWRAL
jgi:DNA polymerase III sliding clamp (beta) subunit (PCNA family)